MSLNVSIGAKINAVKTVQSEIQKQLNNISKNLGITLNNVEFNLTKSSINSIQKQIDILQSTSICSYKINDKIGINAVKFLTHNNQKQQAYGITFNIKL